MKAIAFKSSIPVFHGLHDNRNFFYADFSVRSFFCLKRGDEFHTFVNSITDAAGGCVLKEKVCEVFFFRQRTEAGQDNPGSVLFSSGSGSYIHRVRRR